MLNDLLECSVCLERLDISSRVLPCQHTFCKKCLEEIVATHKELRCPECRVLVPAKIEELPPNVLLMRILEGMKNIPRNKPIDPSVHHDTPHTVSSIIPQQQPTIQTDVAKTEMTKNPVTLHQPCAKALYDYESREPGDLSFKKNDIITLKKRIDANWYHGERNQVQGFFPSTYVQILTPLPNTSVPQCVALYDFKMTAEDEKDCLTFNKGSVVTVIRRVDENWAEGRLSERIGIFPISFVEMNSAAKHLMKSSMNFQPGPSRSAPALPVTNLHNSLNLTSHSHSNSSSTPISTSSESSPSSPSSATSRVHQREKRLSLNVNQQHIHQAQYHRRSADISGRNRCPPQASPDSELQPLVSGASSPVAPSSTGSSGSSGSSSFVTPPALYISLYPYKPQKADELELRKGALYTVSEKCQDGWFKGSSVRTQKIGVFPGNYVQAVRSQPHPHPHPHVNPTSTVMSQSTPSPCVPLSRTNNPHPPPKLPPRALSPSSGSVLSVNNVPSTYKAGGGGGGGTSSSASVPAAVVARLATTPAPAPALSPRATMLINPPPNMVVGAAEAVSSVSISSVSSSVSSSPPIPPQVPVESKKDKDKPGVSLMKRLTSRKKSSPPLLHPYSIDNPVFEDGYFCKPSLAPPAAPVHVRSGSCPSQLLQIVASPERCSSEVEQRESTERSHAHGRHSMGGSQRLRSNKHRPNILPVSNLSMFTRSTSAVVAPPVATNHESSSSTSVVTASSAAMASPRDRDKKLSKMMPPSHSHGVTERFRCITPYPPNSEYEIELRVGDVVYVLKKRDDGWYKGTLHRTGKTGLFPASFVESC